MVRRKSPSPSITVEPPSAPQATAFSSLTDARLGPCRFLQEAIESYRAEILREGKAETTALAYGQHLGDFRRFVECLPRPPLTLADITADVVVAFRDHEIAREKRSRGTGPLSAPSVQRIVQALRGLFKHLLGRGRILLDPSLDLKGPRIPLRLPRDIPTARQMKRLLASPDTCTVTGKRDRAILELLYGTGLRSAELCGLLRGDVDLERRTVFVRKGKGSKDRIVPLGRSAARAVTEYLGVYAQLSRGKSARGDMPLFLSGLGNRIRHHVLRKQLRKHLRRAGLSALKATPHSLRHACATHLLRGGADIRQIQTLLGHSSIEATQIYTKVETADLREMLDRHHPRSWDEGDS